MVSAAEQLAANLNLKTFAKAEDLKKRIWFTLGALLIFRFGTYIPLPGIDVSVMGEIARQNAGGILGIFDKFSGGALGRMTIFALGIMPYISSSIIVQLMTAVSPQLEALKKEGESGRRKLNQYTRYLTVILAILQSYAIAVGLENMLSPTGVSAVFIPGLFFRFTTVVTLLGGTLFLMWLGEQITSRGIGNGTSLIIFSGIVANMPQAIASTLELGRTGALSPFFILFILMLSLGLIAFIVFMERAQRRIIIQYPKRQVGMRVFAGEATHLPIKLNSAGVIPPIFASSLLLLPATVVNLTARSGGEGLLATMAASLQPGNLVHILLSASLIIFFAFFYTAVVFNPTDTAENLKKNGGFIAGYRPGQNTADYLDYVLTRLTLVGALYMAAICVLPEVLMTRYAIPFYLGVTSLLIVVGVSMDTVAQIQSHLLAHQYEGLLKRSKLLGRKR